MICVFEKGDIAYGKRKAGVSRNNRTERYIVAGNYCLG